MKSHSRSSSFCKRGDIRFWVLNLLLFYLKREEREKEGEKKERRRREEREKKEKRRRKEGEKKERRKREEREKSKISFFFEKNEKK